MKNQAILIAVALGFAVWYFTKSKVQATPPIPTSARILAAPSYPQSAMPSVTLQYIPYTQPVELDGGFKEWGVTPDGALVISQQSPENYDIYEFMRTM